MNIDVNDYLIVIIPAFVAVLTIIGDIKKNGGEWKKHMWAIGTISIIVISIPVSLLNIKTSKEESLKNFKNLSHQLKEFKLFSDSILINIKDRTEKLRLVMDTLEKDDKNLQNRLFRRTKKLMSNLEGRLDSVKNGFFKNLPYLAKKNDLDSLVKQDHMDRLPKKEDFDSLAKKHHLNSLVKNSDLDSLFKRMKLNNLASKTDLDTAIQKIRLNIIENKNDIDSLLKVKVLSHTAIDTNNKNLSNFNLDTAKRKN